MHLWSKTLIPKCISMLLLCSKAQCSCCMTGEHTKISDAKAWLATILVGAGGSGHTHCFYTHSVEMGGNVSKIH